MEKMERVKTRSKTVTGNDAMPPCSTQKGAALFQLNMNKISESIKAIRERLISLEQNLERLNQSHDIVVQQVTHLGDSVRAAHALTEKLECLTSHTEQLITLSSISEELQSITQLTQEVNNIREGLTALDNVVYKDD